MNQDGPGIIRKYNGAIIVKVRNVIYMENKENVSMKPQQESPEVTQHHLLLGEKIESSLWEHEGCYVYSLSRWNMCSPESKSVAMAKNTGSTTSP